MVDFEVPPLVVPTSQGSLGLLPARNAEVDPQGHGYSRRTSVGGWERVTHAEFATAVDELARGFMAAEIAPGDRVALMSRTRYEWTLTDFALLTIGAVVVPVYDTSTPEVLAHLLRDSGARAVVVESPEHAARVALVRDGLPQLRDVWTIDDGGLLEVAAGADDVPEHELRDRRAAVDRDTVATIIYTSGTSGRPKGCVLTHGNFLTMTENAFERLREVVDVDGASTLLSLPLPHVFARLIQVVAVHARAALAHSPDPAELVDDLGTFRPTFVLAVPRFFQRVYNVAEQRAVGDGRGRLFARAVRVAAQWSRARQEGERPSLGLRAQHAAMDRAVYSELRQVLGGRITHCISGGAPLGERLGHFYNGIGLPVLEGYGLTETTAAVTVNTPQRMRVGTVGMPLPGVSVRLQPDGEVLVRGAGVFAGYWNDEGATERTLRDGWVRTGDIGELDPQGFLHITGRRHDLVVTAGGLNLSPEPLEDLLRAHPLVAQCVVVGEGRSYVAALVTLDTDMLPLWSQSQGLGALTPDEARSHPQVLSALREAVAAANDSVVDELAIRELAVLPVDLTEANGYLTASHKLRRRVVLEDFADEVEALYSR